MKDALKNYGLDTLRGWLAVLLAGVLLSLMIAIVPVTWQVASDQTASHAYWFEYYDVSPVKKTFKVGEPLEFRSIYRMKRTAKLHWHDILYCDMGNGQDVFFSEYQSKTLPVVKTEGRAVAHWFYNAETPQQAARCRLRSSISVQPRYGSMKTQIVDDYIYFEVTE